MVRTIILAAAGSALLFSTGAAAQASADVRCLILSNAFAKTGINPQAKKAAESSAFYYLGRIDGRIGDAQLRAALEGHAKTIKAATAGAEMQACVRRMQASGMRVQSLAPRPPQPAAKK